MAKSTIVADPDGGAGPGNPNPAQALVGLGGKVFFDANFLGFHINSFVIRANGRIERADSQPIPASESPRVGVNPLGLPAPLGLQIHPNQPVLYVGNVLDQQIGVYDYDRDNGRFGFLRSAVGQGPVELLGVCWLVTNATGTRLYTANNFSNTITVLDISNSRHPIAVQTVPLSQGAGNTAAPFQIALDPAEKFLHVVTQRGTSAQDPDTANSLQVLEVGPSGLLTLVDSVILPTAPSRPKGVVAR